MITDLQMTYAAFDLWLSAEGEDNRAELERVKRILPMILEECCTVKQMEYIKLYFIERMSIREIALHCDFKSSESIFNHLKPRQSEADIYALRYAVGKLEEYRTRPERSFWKNVVICEAVALVLSGVLELIGGNIDA